MSFVGVLQGMIGRIGPWFIHQKNIGRFLQAIGYTYDAAVTSLQQGLALTQPFRCDPSALPVLSIDRSIRLYPSEPEASKRLRLAKWLELHRTRGTHLGELLHSQPYFMPDVPVMRIVHQDGAANSATWWTIDGSGLLSEHVQSPSNWNYDGQTAKFTRYFAIVYIPARLMTRAKYDDGGTYDGGDVYDGMMTQIAKDISDMVREWQGAHSRLQAYIVATDPTSFDPTATAVTDPTGWTSLPVGNWGSPISPPPVAVFTRPPSAFWVYERSVTE